MEALRTSEDRFGLVAESIQDYGIVMLDTKGVLPVGMPERNACTVTVSEKFTAGPTEYYIRPWPEMPVIPIGISIRR
jgi:hypothetical protein